MSINFKVSVDSLYASTAATLLDARGKVEVASKLALDQVAAAILNRLRTTYLAKQAPDGTPWIPSKSGLAREARGTGQTLFKTGRLFRSIQLYPGNDNERIIGTDVVYARANNDGLGKITKRPFLDFTAEHEELALDIFAFQVLKAFKL